MEDIYSLIRSFKGEDYIACSKAVQTREHVTIGLIGGSFAPPSEYMLEKGLAYAVFTYIAGEVLIEDTVKLKPADHEAMIRNLQYRKLRQVRLDDVYREWRSGLVELFTYWLRHHRG